MSTAVGYPHLTIEPTGTIRISGTRYEVIHLAGEHFHHGWSAEEILRQHPDLRPEQAYAALTYFYDHYETMVSQMREMAVTAEEGATRQPLSRSELLKRRSARDL